MIFTATPIKDAFVIDLEKRGDDRGFFARMFCEHEFQEHGLASSYVQMNVSLSKDKGTLRGLHYQLPPRAETKLVRCIHGSLWDVVLDMRPDSATFGKSYGAELSADNRRMMYVPKGCAHGFVTLSEDAEVIYLVDEFYAPAAERGVRWDDPRFEVDWPIAPKILSDKDTTWPDFSEEFHLVGSERD